MTTFSFSEDIITGYNCMGCGMSDEIFFNVELSDEEIAQIGEIIKRNQKDDKQSKNTDFFHVAPPRIMVTPLVFPEFLALHPVIFNKTQHILRTSKISHCYFQRLQL